MADQITEAPAVEQPPTVPEEPKPADDKKKKPRATKEKKPKTASHPPYFQMIKEALLAMSEKSGSSPYAIAKYMEEKHKSVLPANFRKILALQLKNSAAKGKLIKVRASYKLSEAGKRENPKTKTTATTKLKKKPKQPREKTTTKVTRSSSSRAKRAVNKPEAVKKKAGAIKTKPKQPKSIKSPAAKKVKKAAA